MAESDIGRQIVNRSLIKSDTSWTLIREFDGSPIVDWLAW